MGTRLNATLNEIARAQSKRALARYYDDRSINGNDWAIFRVIIGGRKTGKSYRVTDRMCRLKRDMGDNCKAYWLRISDTSIKMLLSNNADKLVDPDLKRRYGLDKLKVKHGDVFNDGKAFCGAYPLSAFGKLKGVGFYDKDFDGKYFIVLDEFQLEQGERRTSFDILYNFIGMVENLIRTTKTNVEIWLLGNTLEEASTILKAFNFIPEKFGRFYLRRKRCVIDNLEPTEEYLADRAGSVASLLGGDEMSNYKNALTRDRALITTQPLKSPSFIIKFGKERSDWYTLWNDNIITRYKGQSCKNVIAMRPYIDAQYTREGRLQIIEMYDARAFRFRNYIDKCYFEDALKSVRTTI